MKPLRMLDARAIRFVLLDIDDTLTTHGKLTAEAYAALQSLKRGGKTVIPVTGRPAGWCDHIARMWPVDAVIGENGAFYFWFAQGKLGKRFIDDPPTRARKRALLDAVKNRILEEMPWAALASDQPYRETDLAIDFCEDVGPFSLDEAERIARLMRAAGLNAKISSIHVNGWFGDYDKLTTSRQMMSELFGVDIEARRDRYVFSGDSPNDAPMFGFFPNAVGVANVRDFAADMDHLPRWITTARSGAGFVELAQALIAARLR
jgi:HAD superfamily hydrolase (TIGR01484 family)